MNTRKTMGSTVIGWVISMMAASMTLFLFYSGYNDYTEIETNTWTA